MLADQQHVRTTQSDLYEKTIADLRQELSDARTQLKESKEKVAEPSSLLLHLQKELLSVKVLAAELCLLVSCENVTLTLIVTDIKNIIKLLIILKSK